jgi:PhnB protein
MDIQPYLFFEGRCEEAIAFYTSALGGKLEMKMTFGECPEPLPPDMTGPDMAGKIMHASMRLGDGVIMLSDGNCKCDAGFKGFSLSYTVPDAKAAERVFNALCEGGNVTLPLGKTFWSPCFGMVQDKFGVGWMVTIPEMKD